LNHQSLEDLWEPWENRPVKQKPKVVHTFLVQYGGVMVEASESESIVCRFDSSQTTCM